MGHLEIAECTYRHREGKASKKTKVWKGKTYRDRGQKGSEIDTAIMEKESTY